MAYNSSKGTRLNHALHHGLFTAMGSGPRPTDDLTPPLRDALFLYQLQVRPNPRALQAESLKVAEVCETMHYANSVFRTLQKAGVIDPETGLIRTEKVDSALVNKIGILPVHKVRCLVNLLFWWEEECTRWDVLDAEMERLRGTIEQAGGKAEEEVVKARARVQELELLKQVLPSKRMADGSLKEQDATQLNSGEVSGQAKGEPPAYVE